MRIEGGPARGSVLAVSLLMVLEQEARDYGCDLVAVQAPNSGEAFAAFVGKKKWSLTEEQFHCAMCDEDYPETVARFRMWLKAGDGPFVGVAGKPRSKLSSRSPCRR